MATTATTTSLVHTLPNSDDNDDNDDNFDPDLLDPHLLDPDWSLDPTAPSLEQPASEGNAFSISWSTEVRAILTGLDSSRLRGPAGPWLPHTPFFDDDHHDHHLGRGGRLDAVVVVLDGGCGGGGMASTGHYRDSASASTGHSSDHMSASLGVTVGYPFLSTSVSAKYDRSVAEDKNDIKASRNSSCRVGRAVLAHTPVLSSKALALLRSRDGAAQFRARYGDYYMCGFVLGADAGACLSASAQSRSAQESLAITVKVKTLLGSASATETRRSRSHTQASAMAFNGYSTLDESLTPTTMVLEAGAGEYEQAVLMQRERGYLAKVAGLQAQVWEAMRGLGLVDGASLSLEECSRLCRSGLVVELLLAPFARLNQYVECVGGMES